MWSGSRYRLYRDTEHGLLAGVCAGIADYLGIERIVIRLGFVVALVFFVVPAALAYIVLAVALPKRPPAFRMSADEAAVVRRLRLGSGGAACRLPLGTPAGGRGGAPKIEPNCARALRDRARA